MPKNYLSYVVDPGQAARDALAHVGIVLVHQMTSDRWRVDPPDGGATYLSPNASWASYSPQCGVQRGGTKNPLAAIVVSPQGRVLAWIGIDEPYASLPEVEN
jgi:hypothetical protein